METLSGNINASIDSSKEIYRGFDEEEEEEEYDDVYENIFLESLDTYANFKQPVQLEHTVFQDYSGLLDEKSCICKGAVSFIIIDHTCKLYNNYFRWRMSRKLDMSLR